MSPPTKFTFCYYGTIFVIFYTDAVGGEANKAETVLPAPDDEGEEAAFLALPIIDEVEIEEIEHVSKRYYIIMN